MSLLHPACIRSFGWLCDWDWVSPVSPVSPSFFSSFMPSSSRSSSAKLFFGKQPMPCLPRNVKRRFGIWFSHKCHFVLHVTKAVQSQHLPTMEATGQTWGGFVQISQHLENTGKSMRTIYIYMLYTSNALSTKTSKIPGAKLAQKMNPLFVTGNLVYLSCKPIRNLYSTGTLPIPTDTLKRCFVVFLFSRICCKFRQELPRTME